MGNTQSGILVTLSVGSIYVFYTHIYCSHKVLKTNAVICSDRLPSLLYLFVKYLVRVLCRTPGKMYTNNKEERLEVAYTVLNCGFNSPMLRWFCSASGYSWDYPDSEYRDIPLCFPERLCSRLLFMVLCAGNFKLSPAGLIRVCQSLKTLQPIDELKKGPFMLHARVLEYRPADTGVEVDILLSASSRSNYLVWESTLTLLSRNEFHKAREDGDKSQPDMPASDNQNTVVVRVPWSIGLWWWPFYDYSLQQLLPRPTRLFGSRWQICPSLWMLSVCLAEIEKHKGVEAIRAPINVTAQFKEPLSRSRNVVVKFWETSQEGSQSSHPCLIFKMEHHQTRKTHMEGFIWRA